MPQDTSSSPGALTLYHELVLEGRAPNIDRFCSHFPEEVGLRARIRALERLRADLGELVGRPLEEEEEELPGAMGGFEPLRLLAAGGMGRVFLAEQTAPRRLCALKLLESPTPLSLERFRREADLAARLSHPGVATVFAFGVEDGVAYLATERVHGFTLRELLSAADRVSVHRPGQWLDEALRHVAEGAPLRADAAAHSPISTSVSLATQVAEALGHAHERGVIHRDVKPSNVMVTFDGQAKLVDFGIAVPADEDGHMTRTGVFVGSHSYAAPEQLRGEHHAVGPWSDTYALAATLFEMLTQRTPFDAAILNDRLATADQPAPCGPRDYNPEVPRALDLLVRRGLDPDPERRFRDGHEMARALSDCPTRRSWLPRFPIGRWRTLAPTTPTLALAWVATVATVVLGGLLLASEADHREQVERHQEERWASASEVLATELKREMATFRACIDHTELKPLHPKASRGFEVMLTVASGHIVNVRVVSAPVGLQRRTQDCLVNGFSLLILPGVGQATPVVLDAELELPIAGAVKPVLP